MSGFADIPVAAMTPDGRRLNLRHGPIDLWIEADGDACDVATAYRQAAKAFQTVLTDLVGELALLRRPLSAATDVPSGPVARRMHCAAMAHSNQFVTPMAAVAGAVADHLVHALVKGRDLKRAYVNNGGDIALYLSPDTDFDIGICANPITRQLAGSVRINGDDAVRGVATSGWRGRSHSFGIADAVTVLGADAAAADAAATMIANEVTLNSPHVQRLPASALSPDSDLGDRPVTVAVDDLSPVEVRKALDSGDNAAHAMLERGLISAAFICLDGEIRIVGEKQLSPDLSVDQIEPAAALEDLNA